jgi:hypothetical protein
MTCSLCRRWFPVPSCPSAIIFMGVRCPNFIHSFIHSFLSLTTCPQPLLKPVLHSPIQRFLFLFPISILKVIHWLLTSSSLSSRHLYPSYLSFSNVFQKTVRTQDVINPISFSSFYCMYHIPLFLDSV